MQSFKKNFLHDSFVICISFIICRKGEFLFNSIWLDFGPFFKSSGIFFKGLSFKIVVLFILYDWSVFKNVLIFFWSVSINLWVLYHIIRNFYYWILIYLIIYFLSCKESLKRDRIFILDNIRVDSRHNLISFKSHVVIKAVFRKEFWPSSITVDIKDSRLDWHKRSIVFYFLSGRLI